MLRYTYSACIIEMWSMSAAKRKPFPKCPLNVTCKSNYCLECVLNLLTPWSRVLLEKLTGFQLIKKSSAFYGTWRFITTFTSARYLSLSWASLIPHPTSWRSILILFFQVISFPQVSPTKTLYRPRLSTIHATCPAHLLLNFIIWTILGEEYRPLSS